MNSASPHCCELCRNPGGNVLWQDARCRVVRVDGPEGLAFPGFCRVIWQAHVREQSDLALPDRRHLLDVVDGVEQVVRRLVQPDKINLASLGNVAPHLHWHVIPRWADDSHFPAPIWAAPAQPARQLALRTVPDNAAFCAALHECLGTSPPGTHP